LPFLKGIEGSLLFVCAFWGGRASGAALEDGGDDEVAPQPHDKTKRSIEKAVKQYPARAAPIHRPHAPLFLLCVDISSTVFSISSFSLEKPRRVGRAERLIKRRDTLALTLAPDHFHHPVAFYKLPVARRSMTPPWISKILRKIRVCPFEILHLKHPGCLSMWDKFIEAPNDPGIRMNGPIFNFQHIPLERGQALF
jgi:hypothetical protein